MFLYFLFFTILILGPARVTGHLELGILAISLLWLIYFIERRLFHSKNLNSEKIEEVLKTPEKLHYIKGSIYSDNESNAITNNTACIISQTSVSPINQYLLPPITSVDSNSSNYNLSIDNKQNLYITEPENIEGLEIFNQIIQSDNSEILEKYKAFRCTKTKKYLIKECIISNGDNVLVYGTPIIEENNIIGISTKTIINLDNEEKKRLTKNILYNMAICLLSIVFLVSLLYNIL